MLQTDVEAAFNMKFHDARQDASEYPVLSRIPWAPDNTPNQTNSETWLKTQLLIFISRNGAIGAQLVENPYIRHEGEFVIHIFTKTDRGTKMIGDILEEVVELYQNKTFDGILSSVVRLDRIISDIDGFYANRLHIPFKTVS